MRFQVLIIAVVVCLNLSVPGFAGSLPAAPCTPNDATCIGPQGTETDRLLQAAHELYKQRKFDEALANLSKAADLSPKDFRPHVLAGFVYLAQRKLKNASQEFENAIQLNPKDKKLYLYKGQTDRLRNAHAEALATYRRAVEVDPNFAEAYSLIGELLMWDKDRQPEGIAAFQKAIKLDPHLFAAYEGLGQLFAYAKRDKEAEEVLRQGMAADPKKMSGRFVLGRMLVKQGRLKEARELWNGRTSDKDNTIPSFIAVLERAEKLQKATDALAKNPKDPDRLIEMGFVVMEGDSWVVDGRQKRAIAYFRQALDMDPARTRAQYGIVKAYIQIADTFKDENKNVDLELAKLKTLDAKLANELEEYRKTYQGGLRAVAPEKDN